LWYRLFSQVPKEKVPAMAMPRSTPDRPNENWEPFDADERNENRI